MREKKKNEKLLYNRHLEIGLVIALCSMIFVFQGWKQFDTKTAPPPVVKPDVIKVEVIRTMQKPKTPPPTRPSVPIETDDPEAPEDLVLPDFDPEYTAPPVPPLPPDVANEPVPFYVLDVEPQPIGGFPAILKHLVYPDIARKAGVEGRVVVNCLLDERGNVIETQIVKSMGNNGCDQAAVDAIMAVKWSPAMQRDKAVRVWVSVPIMFKLK